MSHFGIPECGGFPDWGTRGLRTCEDNRGSSAHNGARARVFPASLPVAARPQ